jgi:hypothetical protein
VGAHRWCRLRSWQLPVGYSPPTPGTNRGVDDLHDLFHTIEEPAGDGVATVTINHDGGNAGA